MPCSPATAATETPGVRQVAKSVALNSGEYLRWVRRVEYLWLSEVLSIVSTIKFVDTILQDLAANLKMTLLDAYRRPAWEDDVHLSVRCLRHLTFELGVTASDPIEGSH
jgi:hypothetical protein